MTRKTGGAGASPVFIIPLGIVLRAALRHRTRTYENYSGGRLAKDAYLKQRAEIDGRLTAIQAQRDEQERLLSELERLDFQDKAQEDDVFIPYAGATELTAELVGTFIKEVLVSSPTEVEIVWKFRDVFGSYTDTKEEEVHEEICVRP